ncbi:MAG: ABC transporter ATP-binding protein [Christensenellaceae bacterium]|jgi:ATP-binding cassette subfamily B protein
MSYIHEEEFTQKVDMNIWKRLIAYAFRYKKLLVALLATLIITTIGDIAFPLFNRYAIDNFVMKETTDGITTYAIVYVATIIVQAVTVMFFLSFAGKLEMRMAYDIRQDAFTKLQLLSFSYYDKTAVGYIHARVISDVGRLSEMIAWGLVDIFMALLYLIGCISIMFSLNVKLALYTLAVFPILAIITVFFQKKILTYYRRVRRANSRITGAFSEGIMGAMTTKTLVREEENLQDFKVLTEDMRHVSARASTLSAIFMPIVMFLSSVGTAFALFKGGQEVLLSIISVGTLTTFISYTTQMFDPIQQLARILAEMQNAQASAERVISLIDTPIDITDTPEVEAVYGTSLYPKRENWPSIKGDVTFSHVDFSYIPEEMILEDFNLHVPAGSSVALVGETGAGKSTIINLICRFYEPTGGQILIDGVDYKERSQLWMQSNLGYVLQQPHLFSGTIRDNIAFGRKDATDEEIHAAARMVHAEGFILEQKDGYHTEVGEGGIRLSTGQKQLISFARVILADPRIFVLDEATSSIDTETEQLIQHAITTVLEGRTSFIVAHRLSTIRNSDMILVIGDGGIIEQGNHETLIKQRGAYYNLYMNQ